MSVKDQLDDLFGATDRADSDYEYTPPNEPARSDGWNSALTNIGIQAGDKRMSTTFATNRVSKAQAEDIWRGDDLGARIIEVWPDEMMREGFTFTAQEAESDQPTEDDPTKVDRQDTAEVKAIQEDVHTAWDDLGVLEKFWEALAFERAYGGGAILIGANDGQADLSMALNIPNVREVTYLTSLEPDELTPYAHYDDPRAPKFGEVAIWQINPVSRGTATVAGAQMILVHETRLLIFPGIRVSRRQFGDNDGFGDTVLNRVWSVLRDYNMTFAAAAILMQDFSQAVFKMKGLAQMISLDQNKLIENRIKAVELSRSVARAIFIDADNEEFERKATPLSGMPDMMDRFNVRLAAAADMPLTRLMGMSPGGLNATGDSDIRLFYDRVKAKQIRHVIPKLTYLTRIILSAKGRNVGNWSVEPNPLWQESQTEIVDRRKVQAETDAINIAQGILHAEEVSIARFGGDEYSHETSIDMNAREELEAAEAEIEARAEEKAAAMALNAPPVPPEGEAPPTDDEPEPPEPNDDND